MIRKWWHEAVIYEIYPRSYRDSNGDGIGDIPGIIEKLDYLENLGVDALWICPVYETPNVDSGYDVSDYYAIANDLGTMEDMEALIEGCHLRGMKVLFELVANHTSDRHKWFQSALNDRKSPYRDYYIWREGKEDGRCPNNWMSSKTGDSVWTKAGDGEAYYMHLYTEGQPDLNWSNPKVREEIYAIMRFWFDKGVDGFRMDVINKIAKAEGLPDVPLDTPSLYGEMYFENYPTVHKYLKEMHQKVLVHYPECVAMGQTSGVSPEQALEYTSQANGELHLFLQFEHVNIDFGVYGSKLPFSSEAFYKSIMKWQTWGQGALWNTVFFGSHDLPRSVSHYGFPNELREESATMLALFQLFLKGTQVVYFGEELGMTNADYEDIEDYVDTRSRSTFYHRTVTRKESLALVERELRALARDNARYPMQWKGERYAGFSDTRPWMKNCDNYREINVDKQMNTGHEQASVLDFYKEIIAMRKNSEVLLWGDLMPVAFEDMEEHEVYAYMRYNGEEAYLIVFGFNRAPIEFKDGRLTEMVLSNYDYLGIDKKKGHMMPCEARVYLVDRQTFI